MRHLERMPTSEEIDKRAEELIMMSAGDIRKAIESVADELCWAYADGFQLGAQAVNATPERARLMPVLLREADRLLSVEYGGTERWCEEVAKWRNRCELVVMGSDRK